MAGKGLHLTVKDLLKEQGDRLKLRLVTGETALSRRIEVSEINRPGLAVSGFLDNFRGERIQIFGVGEHAYCLKAPKKELAASLSAMLSCAQIPCLILSHSQRIPTVLAKACRAHKVPLLRSSLDTATLVGELSDILEGRLSPRVTVHGVLVDVYGLGVFIQGQAGIGKSECALELLKRGHILISDDMVQIQRRRGEVLRGSSPAPLKHYMEVRGLGIIDVRLLFGVGSILESTRIELAVQLEPWQETTRCDRIGLESEKTSILDVSIPIIRIPVSPGRNLAVLIEVAALNERLKGQGYFAARTFNDDLIQRMKAKTVGKAK